MRRFLSAEHIRAVDRQAVEELGLPSLLLMENAARGVTECLLEDWTGGRIVIVCGSGNNGGDGLAVCRQLAARGIASDCLLVNPGKDLSPDAATNRAILEASGLAVREVAPDNADSELRELTRRDWILDAMLGTGIRGEVRDPYGRWIRAINDSPASVLAVDIPSGLQADTGEPCGDCVIADRTVSFVAAKAGFAAPGAARFTGSVSIRHIGTPQSWLHTRFPNAFGD